jgi:hypothetical protein
MDKKPFDHIENKIKEAAANSEPAFDEQAWNKMEAKLDKEKRRRLMPILWFSLSLLCIIVVGSLLFYYNKSTLKAGTNEVQKITAINSTDNDKAQLQSIVATTTSRKQDSLATTHKNKTSINNLTADNTANTNDERLTNFTDKNEIPANEKYYNKKIVSHTNGKAYAKISGGESFDNEVAVTSSANHLSEKKSGKIIRSKSRTIIKVRPGAVIEDGDEAVTNNSDNYTTTAVNNDKKTIASVDKNKIKDSTKTVIKKDTTATIVPVSSVAKKDTTPKRSRFYLLAAIGADASNTAFFSFNNSSITARYGAGIGYQLNKKFSIETGFYAGRKKYIAGPGDYHAKSGSYLSTIDIQKVDANCLVFEIPVTLRYNIFQRAKITYYATAGLSSFIMKKEDYDYYYGANNNSEVAYTYTGNTNLFSICTLSIGIEKKLSNAFSLQAAPSVNIPIAGVGEGTVKLFSTDLQLGIKYNIAARNHK